MFLAGSYTFTLDYASNCSRVSTCLHHASSCSARIICWVFMRKCPKTHLCCPHLPLWRTGLGGSQGLDCSSFVGSEIQCLRVSAPSSPNFKHALTEHGFHLFTPFTCSSSWTYSFWVLTDPSIRASWIRFMHKLYTFSSKSQWCLGCRRSLGAYVNGSSCVCALSCVWYLPQTSCYPRPYDENSCCLVWVFYRPHFNSQLRMTCSNLRLRSNEIIIINLHSKIHNVGLLPVVIITGL